MLCNDVQDLLAVYLDGGIEDADTHGQITRHLAGCAECRAERDSLAGVLAHSASVIKAAGNAINVPDTQPNRVRAVPHIRKPVLRLPFNSNHKDRDKPMTNDTQKPPAARRITALNGIMTFGLSLVLLVFVWLIFNGAMRRSPAGGGTVSPEASQAVAENPSDDFVSFGNGSMIRLNSYEITREGSSFDPNFDELYVTNTVTVSFNVETIDSVGAAAMFVQLIDQAGQVVAAGEQIFEYEPFDGTIETTITIPADAVGTYDLVAGLYHYMKNERLPVLGTTHTAGDALVLLDNVPVNDFVIVTPTPPAAPTVDPLGISGGFRENAVDVSTLPEYVVPNGGGGGGGGGGGCPEVEPRVGIALGGEGVDWRAVCIYGIPDVTDGAEFTLTAVSPSGVMYESDWRVSVDAEGILATQITDSPGGTASSIWTQGGRNTMTFNLNFPAAQEYGEWLVKGTNAAQGDFAIGTINVVATQPIYSVTLVDAVLDPFFIYQQPVFKAGDRLIFAARGLAEGRKLVLALYREDETRKTDSSYVMIPAYATNITVTDEGTYWSEFVVGTDTPLTYFTAMFDPQPNQYAPEQWGLVVE